MIALICFALVGVVGKPTASDTIDVAPLASAPVLDGRVASGEYAGDARVRIETAAGNVRVWIAQHGDFLYIAATLPDSTFYWGDDFVVSVDANGSADATPQAGDRQWYLRRTLDSSVVSTAITGGWSAPGAEPPALGPARHADDWDVASSSSPSGWTVELRIRVAVFASGSAPSRIAFRTYNDGPRGWWSWPEPRAGTPPQRVERSPLLWTPLRLTGQHQPR